MFAARDPKPTSMRSIERTVADHYRVANTTTLRRSRDPSVILARHVAMHIIRITTGASYAQIGRRFHRDPSTVHHAHHRIEALAEQNPRLRATLARICNDIRQ